MSVTDGSFDRTLLAVADILDNVGTDLSRSVACSLREGRHQEVLDLRFPDPESQTFREDYLAVEIASKYPYLDVKVDREAVAYQKFFEIEERLRSSDALLYRAARGWHNHRPLHAVLHTARRKIAALLGDFHREVAESYFSFGPGATVSLPRRKASYPNKFSNPKLTVTQNCLDLAVFAVCRNECWADYLASRFGRDPTNWFKLVAGNKVVTVPKSAKTDRTIAIEPDMNMFVQKGIGGLIRRRLKTVGVDLDDQTLNQSLARDASLSGDLGTIDLSSASDSVSLRLVEDLLPPDWVDALKATRSPRGTLPDGRVVTYRKVSSMGNGYTFELESLIFWAFIQGVFDYLGATDRRFRVYGDDLIVPSNSSACLIECLTLVGFTPNSKKTHLTGPFRESCGKHYLKGDDVTPFYVKDRVETSDRKFWLLNSLSVWSLSQGFHYRRGELKPAWDRILSSIPLGHRRFGPLFLSGDKGIQMSDICIGVSFDECVPQIRRAPHGVEAFAFPSRVRKASPGRANSVGSLIGFLDRFGRFYLKPRCEFSLVKGREWWENSVSLTRQWHDVGPWLTTAELGH